MRSLLKMFMPLAAASCLAAAPATAAEPQLDKLVFVTCGEAAHKSASARDQWLEMVVELAYRSIESRQLQFSAMPASGAQLGLLIDEICRREPDSLLVNAVDLSVRLTYTPAGQSGQAQPALAAAPVPQVAEQARLALARLAFAEGYAKSRN